MECRVANGKEYPILWMKKQDGDMLPLSTGKNLVMKNTAKFDLRCVALIIKYIWKFRKKWIDN